MRKPVMVAALALLLAACTSSNISDGRSTTGSGAGTASETRVAEHPRRNDGDRCVQQRRCRNGSGDDRVRD